MAEIVVDRPRPKALAVAAAWVLFCIAFLAEAEVIHASDVITGGLLGAVLVGVGFYAAARVRPLPERTLAQRSRLGILSLLAGAAAGGVIIGQLLVLATIDRGEAAGVVSRVPLPLVDAMMRAYGAAVVEEVVMRLFGMSVIAWIAAHRYGKDERSAFRIALYVTALLFGLVHLPSLSVVGLTLVVFNGLGGLLLGWIFWRWGLPYAILCHFVADVIIQALGPGLLA